MDIPGNLSSNIDTLSKKIRSLKETLTDKEGIYGAIQTLTIELKTYNSINAQIELKKLELEERRLMLEEEKWRAEKDGAMQALAESRAAETAKKIAEINANGGPSIPKKINNPTFTK